MEDKKSLASSEERALIKGKASLLAAVDYYVSMHSDIFISASPGNMHNAVVSYSVLDFVFLYHILGNPPTYTIIRAMHVCACLQKLQK